MKALLANTVTVWAVSVGLTACGGGTENSVVSPDASTEPDASSEDAAVPKCNPTGDGPHWLLETETVSVTFRCDSENPEFAAETFELLEAPEAAVFDETTQTLSWTTDLDDAVVTNVLFRARSTGEEASVKIGVADNWQDENNVPVIDPLQYPEEYGLPVLFLDPGPANNVYEPITIRYRGRTYNMLGKKRGAASLSYPKNSYTLNFENDDRFNEPVFGDGFLNKNKVVLISSFDDNSYVRQRLAYDIWNRTHPMNVPIKTYSAVIYKDGEYWGLYTVADHIDRHLMEEHGHNEDGNLYKAINHDANFRLTKANGNDKGTLHDGYEKKEGLPETGDPTAFSDLEELVNFVATSDDNTFLSEIGNRIVRSDYESWWMMVYFTHAGDSAGKNSYHYRDATNNGPFRALPWDMNHALGQNWKSERLSPYLVSNYQNRNEIFTRFFADPTTESAIQAQLQTLLNGAYHKDALHDLIDGYLDEIGPNAARNEAKWDPAYRTYSRWNHRTDFLTHLEEVAYVKQWISDRWDFLKD